MKNKITPSLVAALALLLLSGCTEPITYDVSKKIEAKWPGCEIVDQNSWVAPVAFVRTPDGMVFEVWYRERKDDLIVSRVLFPAKK